MPTSGLFVAACLVISHAGGAPPAAWPTTPAKAGELVDRSFTLAWRDSDLLAATTTSAIDWFYTPTMPPTFGVGTVPVGLEARSVPIVRGIREADRANRWEWDTSSVAAGSYFVWSIVNEADVTDGIKVVAFSRGTVTVAHPGDLVHPSVIMATPENPFAVADAEFEVIFEASDPDGSGVIRIEATHARCQSTIVLADGLPASQVGRVAWDTSSLPDGEWSLFATIRDRRDLAFSAYGRFLLRIEHAVAVDCEVPMPAAPIGSTGLMGVRIDGCGCAAQGQDGRAWPLGVLFALAVVCRRRR